MVVAVLVRVVTLEAAARNATNAARSDTLLVIATKAAEEVTEAVTKVEEEGMAAGMVDHAKARPATHVADMDTCLEIVLKAKSVTIVCSPSPAALAIISN